MMMCRNAEGVHGRRKVGNPCFNGSMTLLHAFQHNIARAVD